MAMLEYIRTESLMKKYNIPTPAQFLAKSADEAVRYAKIIGYPVVIKVVSKEIIHKTEMKGVITNIENEKELVSSYSKMLRDVKRVKKAWIDGILVQKFIRGYETIVGGKMDFQFGPVILFGGGGIFAEVMRDVSLRICPINKKEAMDMIMETKISRILKGYRGRDKAYIKGIADVLVKVCKMMQKERISELDINPLIVTTNRVSAVDVRVII